MPTLNYNETLDMVEAFMEASGIRKYCTEICKGMCCESCYTSKNACHKQEGRRMSCSVYMCYFEVKGRGKDFFAPYKAARRTVNDEAQRIYTEYTGCRNRYFKPPPKIMFRKFMIQGWPPAYMNYKDDTTCVELIKVGLRLTYAAKFKVIMNKVTRVAQELMRSSLSPGPSFKHNPRLSQFEVRRVKRNKRLKWEIRHWETGLWL